MHNAYEELCALAITGQVTDSERATLDEHMRECEECRTLMEQMHPEVSYLAPAMAELLRVDVAVPEGMRDRFLHRAVGEGLLISAGEDLSQAASPASPLVGAPKAEFWTRCGAWLDGILPPRRFLGYSAAAACALCVSLAVGRERMVHPAQSVHDHGPDAVALNKASGVPEVVKPAPAASVSPVRTASPTGQEEQELRAQLALLSQRLEAAAAKADALEAANAQLERSISSTTQQAESIAAERDAQRNASQAANSQVAALRQQLDDAQSKILTLDAVAAMQEKQTNEAQLRVASLKAEMDQMYAARSSAEAMISARNLHIIDVYDDTGKGSGQGAFGRVFYVQGKSLVFYAYDLPNPKRDKDFSFQLWGEGQGLEPTTYKLGLLRPDGGGHGRWVVACDDPKILGRLRGVYIAPPSSKGDVPSPSKKMMYAMLGSANHP